ncbi:MAG: hypothetical protein A2Y94_14480 [Caldithrix sp. RBG_13_44_9]|nr:MAG: hypothetical protein A2Y94_14480 [Caldithrix sp. RBG_13_44_9]
MINLCQQYEKSIIRTIHFSLTKMRILWICILSYFILHFLFFPCLLFSADKRNFVFEHITMEQGLSQSTILAITQDQFGFLWLGTQEGLNRYDGYDFTIYKHDPYDKNSLSDNWVTVLFVDQEGYLWVGTNAGGINLFDPGNNGFIRYLHDPDDPGSISDNRILTIYQDRAGSIWVGTMGGGLNRFDKIKKSFENYQFGQKNREATGKFDVTAVLEDREGCLWWGTNNAGLYQINWKKSIFENYRNDPADSRSLSCNQISCLYQDTRGRIWISTNGGGLNRFDPKSKVFKQYRSDPTDPNSLTDDHIYAICEDRLGNLWIGTDDGLNFLSPLNGEMYSVKSDPSIPTGLSNNMIRSIFQDRGGILWVGTYSGALNKYDRKKSVFKNYTQNLSKMNSLSDKNVWSIFEDNRGYIWIGTNNGLNRLDRTTDQIVHYFNKRNDPRSLSHNLVRTIFQDSQGDLWIGTEGSGLNRYDYKKNNFERFTHDPANQNSISDNSLRHIYEDTKRNLWIATLNGLNKFDPKRKHFKKYYHNPQNPNSLSGNHVRYIYEDKRGAIWVATFNGLSLYIKKEDRFISFRNSPSNPASLSNDRVLCFHEDHAGRFWIGTYGGGLELLDRNEFIFTHYSKEVGLPNDAIYGILEDDEGNLWLSTNQGLLKFNPETRMIKNFESSDGIQGNEFNGNAFFKNKKGEMFFGGINGITLFSPQEVRENTFIPKVVLTSFKKYDQEVKLAQVIYKTDQIDLSYKDNFFSFEFAALDFSTPGKNKYAYKLDGFDKEWIYCSTRRYANYTNLNGGNYTFRVKGSNNDGLWNEEGISLKVMIEPPFWQTWWFKFTMVMLILLLVYAIIALRMRSVNSQKRKLELEVSQRTRELNQSNYELLRAKRDTDDILNHVEEGLFLINSGFEIGSQYSLALERMLNEKNIAHLNFLKLLERKVNNNVVTSTNEYLQLMFKNDVDEEALKELNPLQEVEINFTDENDAWIYSKYLNFNFKRICDDHTILNLIATVIDVTDQVHLTKKLKLSEERTQNQMEWLVNILHIEPALLNEFLAGVDNELNYVDSLLKHAEGNGNLRHILEEIYRSMHLIKGNATLLDLKFFADLAHQFEDRINEVKRNTQIQASDFIPLVLRLGELKQRLYEVKKIIERMSSFHQHFQIKKSEESDLLLRSIKNLIQNLAKDLEKEVEFNYSNFQSVSLPYQYRLLVKEILIQFVRNALYHGIESPQERILNKKRPLATITLYTEVSEDVYSFTFRDDGRGIQINKLQQLAIASEKYPRKQIENWSDRQIAQLIFEPEFTTAEKANHFAGRGIGLDIIYQKILKHKGNIELNFEKGSFCEFKVSIPLKKTRKISVNRNKRKKQITV